jgi:hypothetical protein
LTTACDTCALGEGKGAACEPYNALRAQICVLGGIPFACHAGFNWRGGKVEWFKVPRNQRKMCGGWQREVRALSLKGYFDEYRSIRRAVAEVALDSIEEMIQCSAEDDESGNTEAKRKIERCLRILTQRDKAKFERTPLNVFTKRTTRKSDRGPGPGEDSPRQTLSVDRNDLTSGQ